MKTAKSVRKYIFAIIISVLFFSFQVYLGLFIAKDHLEEFNLNRISDSLETLAGNVEPVSLVDLEKPIIYLKEDEFETVQNGLWVNVTSSEKLNEESLDLNLHSTDNNIYKYTFYIEGFEVGENEFEIEFTSLSASKSTEDLNVYRKKLNSIGLWDIEQEVVLQDATDLLARVDKTYCVSYNFEPSDLVKIDKENIPTLNNHIMLRKNVSKNLKQMIENMKKQDLFVKVVSGYRSFNHQLALYQSRVKRDGSKYADRQVARPGHSEHQLGTAVDLTSASVLNGTYSSFEYTPSAKWLEENSYKYGFVLSYPKDSEEVTGYNYEAWHFRYVGKEAASDIRQSEMVPIEYIKALN